LRALILAILLLSSTLAVVPAASAGWTVVCAPKLGCFAGACAVDCGPDNLVCFELGPTAPPACVVRP
jgi:hypothetical protein